jgi:hypothetical protein
MSCPGDLYVVPGANPCAGGGGGAGVATVNGLSGTVDLTSLDGTINITTLGQNVVFTSGGVNTLNTLNGAVNLVSSDATVTITTSGTDIDLQATLPAGDATAYFDATNVNVQLLNTDITIYAVNITLTTQATIFATSKVIVFNNPVAANDVNLFTTLIVGDGTGLSFTSPYTLETVQSGHHLTGINTGMVSLPPGTYTVSLLARQVQNPPSPVPTNGTLSINQNSGSLNIIANLSQATIVQRTEQFTIGPFGYAQFGGAVPVILGNYTGLPTVSPIFNTDVSITLEISGVGSGQNNNNNDLSIGLFQNGDTFLGGYSVNDVPMDPFDWGTVIPQVSPPNQTATFTMPLATYQAGAFGFGVLLAAGGNFFTITDLNMRLSITYNV